MQVTVEIPSSDPILLSYLSGRPDRAWELLQLGWTTTLQHYTQKGVPAEKEEQEEEQEQEENPITVTGWGVMTSEQDTKEKTLRLAYQKHAERYNLCAKSPVPTYLERAWLLQLFPGAMGKDQGSNATLWNLK